MSIQDFGRRSFSVYWFHEIMPDVSKRKIRSTIGMLFRLKQCADDWGSSCPEIDEMIKYYEGKLKE